MAARGAAEPEGDLSLRALSAASGMTDAGILYHYGSRDGLFVAAAAAALEQGSFTPVERDALLRELLRIGLNPTSKAFTDAVVVLEGVIANGDAGDLLRRAIASATGVRPSSPPGP